MNSTGSPRLITSPGCGGSRIADVGSLIWPALQPGSRPPGPGIPAWPPGTSATPAAVADRTSLVSVCRSTLMNRRQPIRWYQVSLVQPHGLARRYR